jgi:hypothetical protein
LGEHIGAVDPWKCVDQLAGKSFAINAQAWPCRVELLEVVALVKLAREFEVMEDTKDSLNDPHSRWHPSAHANKRSFEQEGCEDDLDWGF